MGITQRTACLSDAELLLSWRNQATTRQFSGHSQLISPDEHLRWFTARLKRTYMEPYFLFTLNQKPVGTSRLDIVTGSDNEYEISILVDPEQNGQGLGTQILEMTCASIINSHPKSSILAKVHKDNLISQKLFMRAGFKLMPLEGKSFHFKKIL